MIMKKILAVCLGLICGLSICFGQEFQVPQAPKAQDEVWVLCIGNSFTYFFHSDQMLCEIAENQGLHIKIGKYLKGGQTFGQHMGIEESRKARQVRGYDYAFLQDQSVNPARLARDKNEAVLTDFLRLKDEVLEYSPDCKVILERTWGYPGNKAGDFGTWLELDKYLKKGTAKMARKGHTKISPIGEAFKRAIWERPDIAMFGPDGKHQSREGSYLKACVNYLMITGKAFAGEVPSCEVNPEKAAALRAIAEKTVLGNC